MEAFAPPQAFGFARSQAGWQHNFSMKISKIRFSKKNIFLETSNGKVMSAELWRFPRLMQASSKQRKNWKQFDNELRWESIDEDIGLKSFKLNPNDVNVIRFS